MIEKCPIFVENRALHFLAKMGKNTIKSLKNGLK
jgi:hypothetical protein